MYWPGHVSSSRRLWRRTMLSENNRRMGTDNVDDQWWRTTTTNGVDERWRRTVLTNKDDGRCWQTMTTDGVDEQWRRTVLTNKDDGRCWQTVTTETRWSTMKINEILFIYTATNSINRKYFLATNDSSDLTPTSSHLPHTLTALLRHLIYCRRCSCARVLYIPRGRGGSA